MSARRRSASAILQGLVLAALLTPPAPLLAQVTATEPVRLFRVVTMRGDVVIGLTPAQLDALGQGPDVERLARRIAQEGQLTAWRYVVTRAADGTTRLATRDRVAVLRQDALMVEPYAAALPVASPPAE